MIALTPAGLALCAMLGVTPCTGVDLFIAATSRLAPAEHRYEILVGCTYAQIETDSFCGRDLDCVAVGTYVTHDGNAGLDRLCRKPQGEPVS